MARYIAGWKEYLPGCDDRAWGNLWLTVEYSRSRNGERIAQYLFGSTQLHFSGSEVVNRNGSDLLADYFGLPTTFQGSLAFEPRIDNIILVGNYYLGLDQWCDGLYFRCTMPVVVTRWDLGIHFPTCYMSSQKDTDSQLLPNQADTALSIREALSGTFLFGDMQQPFMFGAFACGREQKTAVAQLDAILGYDNAGVAYTRKGITVSNTLQTTAKNIYAAGDIIGPYLFSHMAEYQAAIATRTFFKKKIDYTHAAWITFTDPELATAGLTENQVREQYGDSIQIYRTYFKNYDRPRTDGRTTGMAKFICDKRGYIIGAHIFGARAGDLIGEVQLGKYYNHKLYACYPVIHPYPTNTDVM